MTRKKVKLAYITNDSARKATFKKRKKGLLKKVSELTTLCDVEACAIIYSPYESQPEVFPSPLGVQRVLGRFRRMPEMEQSKKMVNQEGFLRHRIAKATDQLKKLRRDNREKELSRLMFQGLTSPAASRSLHTLSLADLNDLSVLIDRTMADVGSRLQKIAPAPKEERLDEIGDEAEAKPLPLPPAAAWKKRRDHLDAAGKPQWFMELMLNHHDDQIVNFPFGDGASSSQWGNARVFP